MVGPNYEEKEGLISGKREREREREREKKKEEKADIEFTNAAG